MVALGVLAQWIAARLRLPSILLLLIFGLAAGPFSGLLDPDGLFGDLLFPLVSISVAIILLEGGLSLRWSELGIIGSVVRNLISVGAAVTWVMATLAGHFIAGLSWPLATLLGAILVVTGPTVIIPLLLHIRPRRRVGVIARWEGIVIDPIGAILAVLVYEGILAGDGSRAAWQVSQAVVLAGITGLLFGLLAAGLLYTCMRRYWISDALHSPATLGVALTAYGLSDLIQPETGLLSVTVMGIALASQNTINLKSVVEFKENLRVLLISSLFILLAARIDLDALSRIGARDILFVLVLIVVARPVGVLLSTWGSPLSWQERVFLGWLAPRGIVAAAVSSLFALRMLDYDPQAERLVSLTFLVIIVTVALYGLTSGPLAYRLGVASANPQGLLLVGAQPWVCDMARILQEQGIPVRLVDSNAERIVLAQRMGLSTYHGSALTDAALSEIDLDGIGRLLAVTPNDEVNALAALHFREIFGRENIYQLPPASAAPDSGKQEPAPHLHGRYLFGLHATSAHLAERLARGAVVKAIHFTDAFRDEHFRSLYKDRALPLLLLDNSRRLKVIAADSRPTPAPGNVLISLVEEQATGSL